MVPIWYLSDPVYMYLSAPVDQCKLVRRIWSFWPREPHLAWPTCLTWLTHLACMICQCNMKCDVIWLLVVGRIVCLGICVHVLNLCCLLQSGKGWRREFSPSREFYIWCQSWYWFQTGMKYNMTVIKFETAMFMNFVKPRLVSLCLSACDVFLYRLIEQFKDSSWTTKKRNEDPQWSWFSLLGVNNILLLSVFYTYIGTNSSFRFESLIVILL